MITIKARLARSNDVEASYDGCFHVIELKTVEGDDLSDLVRHDDVFKTVEELSAFLTLRLAREARAEITE